MTKKWEKLYLILTNPIVVLTLLFFLLIIGSLGDTIMKPDEGMWSYIGRVWFLDGIPPYVGAVDNKTPGIYMLNALSYAIMGVNVFFVRALGVVSILLTSYTVYLIGKKMHSAFAGIVGMYIFGLTIMWYKLDGFCTADTETFMLLFSTLSFYYVLKGKESICWKGLYLIAGIFIGFAIMFKQIALTTTIALFIFYFIYPTSNQINHKKGFGFFLLGIGLLISSVLSIVPLLYSGLTLKEYIDGVWLILLHNGTSRSNLFLRIVDAFNIWVNSRIVVFYPLLILVAFKKELIRKPFFLTLIVWFFFDFIGVNASGFYFGHQIKQLIPSLSIIVGVHIAEILNNFNSSVSYMKKMAASILFVISLLFPYHTISRSGFLFFSDWANPEKEIGVWIKENTSEGDFIYVFGRSTILSYSERISSSKHFSKTYDNNRTTFFSEIKEKQPKYIVKRRTDARFGHSYHYLQNPRKETKDVRIDSLMGNYTIVKEIDIWDIYKRN